MLHLWAGREKHTGVLLENLKEGNYLEDANIDGRITVEKISEMLEISEAADGFLKRTDMRDFRLLPRCQ